MKNKLIVLTLLFTFLIFGISAYFYFTSLTTNDADVWAEQIIALNEIEQLIRLGDTDTATRKAVVLQETMRELTFQNSNLHILLTISGCCFAFLLLTFGYIYVSILRPFKKLENFAEKIAQGNLNIPLDYERTNYFGKFTWAFDSMRKEITKARACEREAIENNKTVIATLSHDIKTPIASIRAYAEGLEANMDNTPQRRAKYLSVIMKKCDEVAKLTNDLFLHSLSNLDKLEINLESFEVCEFLKIAVDDISARQQDVHFANPHFSSMVFVDKNRLMQITENIINNARKYAKTNIQVSLTRTHETVEIHFRDFGPGIPDEDIPFIFDKFYRGKNCGDEQGSGLGLYIVKYLTEKMDGNVLLHNHPDGLEVTITLPFCRIMDN